MIELIYQLILSCPTIVEVIDDRKGDSHKTKTDVVVRIILIVLVSIVSAIVHALYVGDFFQWLWKSLVLSIMYFVTFFNYLVNYVQRSVTEDPRWYDHLNDVSWPDSWPFWRRMHWEWRMVIVVCLFGVAVLYYAS